MRHEAFSHKIIFPGDCDAMSSLYYKTGCFKQNKFITEDTKVKHSNITTIYRVFFKWKVYTKQIKTTSLGAQSKWSN